MARRLIQLGVKPKTAWRRVYEGREALWALSHDSAVHRGLREYFAERGLVSLVERRFAIKWKEVNRAKKRRAAQR